MINEIGSKPCSTCKVIKDLTEFSKHKKNKDGLSYICKKCNDYRHSEWLKNNSLKIKKYKQEYHQKNKIKHNRKSALRYKNCLSEVREYNKEHKSERNKYRRKRYKSDLEYKIKQILRSRLRKVIKNNSKSNSVKHLLGCSIEFLKKYLEAKFQEGMTWQNHCLYGWHIDHIQPCCTFDLSKPEEQRKCFHYTNLQPLWADDNLRKKKGIY